MIAVEARRFQVEDYRVREVGGKALFEFNHRGKILEACQSIGLVMPAYRDDTTTVFWAVNGNNILGYFIGGLYPQEQTPPIFEVCRSQNLGREINNGSVLKPDFVPYVVGELCAAIVNNGVVSKWLSGELLYEYGDRMYERLSIDPRLKVTRDFVTQRYEVVKKHH